MEKKYNCLMTQKYISVIKLKKQIVTGAMGLLRITTIYLYVSMGAMAQSLKSLYTKRDNQLFEKEINLLV